MSALILFCAIGTGSVMEYDHGYYTMSPDGQQTRWVPMKHMFTLVGAYQTRTGPALVLSRPSRGETELEVVNLDDFRDHTRILNLKPRKKPLLLFSDRELDHPDAFRYDKPR